MSRYDESIDRILDIEINNIIAVKKSLNRETMEKVIDLMLQVKPTGHKVITAGCGTSGTLAERVAHSLCVVEVPATFCAPGNSEHGGMGIIQQGDVVVFFSKGGNTGEILNYIPCCKAKGATIIGVTQNDDSILARESDVYFKIMCEHEADIWDMCASASCSAITAIRRMISCSPIPAAKWARSLEKKDSSNGFFFAKSQFNRLTNVQKME